MNIFHKYFKNKIFCHLLKETSNNVTETIYSVLQFTHYLHVFDVYFHNEMQNITQTEMKDQDW
jgi:hypothetical protein